MNAVSLGLYKSTLIIFIYFLTSSTETTNEAFPEKGYDFQRSTLSIIHTILFNLNTQSIKIYKDFR